MIGVTRKRGAMRLASLTITFVLVLILGTAAMAASPILHKVSVGGPDSCLYPGCDGNFSLIAIQFADGSVEGEFTDQFGGSFGFHAVIDCLEVEGNQAWVSGVITHGFTSRLGDVTGLAVSTMLEDNGVSANDPDDAFSFSYIGDLAFTCTDKPDADGLDFYEAPFAQVKIK